MGTIITVIIVIYCIILLFLMIEKRIDKKSQLRQKSDIREDQTGKLDDDWTGFSVGFKSSPFLKNYDFPDD